MATSSTAPDASRHMFSGLRDHGEKIEKFKQRKSTHRLTPTAFHNAGLTISASELTRQNATGYCVGIAMQWAAMKHETPEVQAHLATAAPPNGDVHAQNSRRVFDAALGKLNGLRDMDYDNPIEGMLAQFGMTLTAPSSTRFGPVMHISRTRGTATQVPPAMALARASSALAPGQTVMAVLKVYGSDGSNDTSHVVTLHRTDDGTLRFFDPNAGEYTVNQTRPFFETWVQSYQDGRGVNLNFDLNAPFAGFYPVGPGSAEPPSSSDSESSDSE